MAGADTHIFDPKNAICWVKLKLLIFIFSLLLFSACLSSDWNEAKLKDSIESYESFIKKYPESENINEAKERIQLLEWESVKEINTKRSYYQFLAEYPDGEMASVAKRHIIDLEWKEVREQDQIKAYHTFIKSYPKSNHAKNAKKRIIELDWDEVAKKNRISAYKEFVSKYEESPYTKEAERAIEKLELTEKEFDHYKKAKKLNTLNSYIEYLAIYPKGKYTDKIQHRLLGKLPAKLSESVRGLFSKDAKKQEEGILALYGQEPRDINSILVILLGFIGDEEPDIIDESDSEEAEVNHLYELLDLFNSMDGYVVPELITLLNNQNIPLGTRKKIITILVSIYDERAAEPFSRILNSYNSDCLLRLHLVKNMINRE